MVQGESPTCRVGQAATLLADGKSVMVHGGHDPNDSSRCFDDSFILDTTSWRWNAVDHGYAHTTLPFPLSLSPLSPSLSLSLPPLSLAPFVGRRYSTREIAKEGPKRWEDIHRQIWNGLTDLSGLHSFLDLIVAVAVWVSGTRGQRRGRGTAGWPSTATSPPSSASWRAARPRRTSSCSRT